RVGGYDTEGVVVFRPEMAVRPQQHPHFLLRLKQMAVIDRGARVGHAIARSPDLEVGLNRDDDEVVLRLAEHRSLRLADTDHLERNALDLDRLADRAGSGKELVLQIAADESYIHVARIFGLG